MTNASSSRTRLVLLAVALFLQPLITQQVSHFHKQCKSNKDTTMSKSASVE